MANDLARTIDRNRSIFTNLLKQLPSTDRDLHLTKLADAYQERIDDVLAILDGAPPSGRASRPRISRVPEAPVPGPVSPASGEHVHTPTCEHVQAAVVERADNATVPGAIRAVLATESTGLLPRQIIDGVRVLRPDTDEASVHGALFQMRKRGEVAREGFHKNYRYRLTGGQGSLSSLGSGVVRVANDGGATH